jgi:hypothetical protein
VFYVHASGTFACGAALASTCKYLEAAPTSGTAAWTDVTRTWATNVNSNQTTSVTGAARTAIGSGYQNSLAIVAQTGNVAASSAAVLAREYGGGSKTDWHLPSKDELNQLRIQRSVVGAGFQDYWSSSQSTDRGQDAWNQNFFNGDVDLINKNNAKYVRPVRAFG